MQIMGFLMRQGQPQRRCRLGRIRLGRTRLGRTRPAHTRRTAQSSCRSSSGSFLSMNACKACTLALRRMSRW